MPATTIAITSTARRVTPTAQPAIIALVSFVPIEKIVNSHEYDLVHNRGALQVII